MEKAIIITGAGSGLGRSLARRLAGYGNTLFLIGRDVRKLEAVANELEGARAISCDVGDPASVADAFEEVARYTPRVDVLINNAGLFQPAMIAEASDAHIRDLVNVNLNGAIFCSRAAIPLMKSGSHILSIGSETVVVPVAMLAIYQASKAGLERFMQTLAQEVEPLGIRTTMVRAGKMYEEEMEVPYSPELYQRFAEENRKLGLDQSKQPISHYASVAAAIAPLLELPDHVNVRHVSLEGRFG
jgi:NAD(P)-dependent dehydrogenase (short-subunit alcohol dehydrogenase family)